MLRFLKNTANVVCRTGKERETSDGSARQVPSVKSEAVSCIVWETHEIGK